MIALDIQPARMVKEPMTEDEYRRHLAYLQARYKLHIKNTDAIEEPKHKRGYHRAEQLILDEITALERQFVAELGPGSDVENGVVTEQQCEPCLDPDTADMLAQLQQIAAEPDTPTITWSDWLGYHDKLVTEHLAELRVLLEADAAPEITAYEKHVIAQIAQENRAKANRRLVKLSALITLMVVGAVWLLTWFF